MTACGIIDGRKWYSFKRRWQGMEKRILKDDLWDMSCEQSRCRFVLYKLVLRHPVYAECNYCIFIISSIHNNCVYVLLLFVCKYLYNSILWLYLFVNREWFIISLIKIAQLRMIFLFHAKMIKIFFCLLIEFLFCNYIFCALILYLLLVHTYLCIMYIFSHYNSSYLS